jgi:DNA-binding transcriptional regulator YhcF (GntR family)
MRSATVFHIGIACSFSHSQELLRGVLVIVGISVTALEVPRSPDWPAHDGRKTCRCDRTKSSAHPDMAGAELLLTPQPSLVEQAYEAILEEIADGTLAPHTHLVQEDLAARYDVSRQPIQQALLLLENDGIVLDAGRRGLIVAPLDLRMMRDRYQVRATLDALAALLAAQRCAASPEVRARCRLPRLHLCRVGQPDDRTDRGDPLALTALRHGRSAAPLGAAALYLAAASRNPGGHRRRRWGRCRGPNPAEWLAMTKKQRCSVNRSRISNEKLPLRRAHQTLRELPRVERTQIGCLFADADGVNGQAEGLG